SIMPLTEDALIFSEPYRNVGLELVRVTEEAAMAASRWIGSGNYQGAHMAADHAMFNALCAAGINGVIEIGEESRAPGQELLCGRPIIEGPLEAELDLALDPVDGTNLLIKGRPGAISVMGIAPRGAFLSPLPARYMDKIVVDREAADVLVPECMDAPAAWTLALVARVKKKPVRNLTVIVLARARHEELIEEIRATGARIILREEGDVSGALLAALVGTSADILMGVGGASQGVLSACAAKSLGGMMLARLAPQSREEREEVEAAGLDLKKIYTCHDLVRSDNILFSATGITNSELLKGIRVQGKFAHIESLLVRSETGTRRFIHAERALEHFTGPEWTAKQENQGVS
ncbi:MAG: fructose-bisphosphatase class II family protein, partial [Candidatus Promineifilaceae bacterium]|nr:fructose-bisphosphatase class II family protein [Candidatus Promineifilaceae bacterium]